MNLLRCALVGLSLLVAVPEVCAQGFGGPIDWDQVSGDLQQLGLDYVDDATGGASGAVLDGNDAMTDMDREVDNARSRPEPGAPEIPASCLGREGCEECFGRAYEKLGRSRILLARARALFDATHRFATASQALGDNLAPSTREAAIVWQAQKPRIARSLTQLDATYDRKIADMLAALRRTLQEIGECEARYYNNPDWFARFGFIYYEFMKARYERS